MARGAAEAVRAATLADPTSNPAAAATAASAADTAVTAAAAAAQATAIANLLATNPSATIEEQRAVGLAAAIGAANTETANQITSAIAGAVGNGANLL